MRSVELDNVTVERDGSTILRDVDVSIGGGDVLALIGTSGSGKTTALRTIAGLDDPSRGRVRFDGYDVTALEPADRNVAFVFQQPVLFAHRNVGRNISFPLELRHEAIDEIRKRVGAEARALHIESLLQRRPRELSAGEAQAVQVARALVRRPDVLLLDEPFSTVDAHQTDHLRREVAMIQRGFGVTTVLAANESLDAMTMADRVAVLADGRVTQIGRPLEVYDQPATVNAALLTGDADVIDVEVTGGSTGSWLVRAGLRVRVWSPAMTAYRGRRMQLVMRPEWWQLDPAGLIEAHVERAQVWGPTTSLWCRVGGQPMTVKLPTPRAGRVSSGDVLRLRVDRMVLVDPVSEMRVDLG